MDIGQHYRLATPAETEFYKTYLYPLQDRVFALCSDYDDLYLTGGTALARYYFQHRWSDDLDLFIRITANDSDDVIHTLKRADLYARDLAGKLARRFTISRELYSAQYSRFFV